MTVVRETLRCLQRLAPVMLHEVPSGAQVFDWTVPREWNIRDAYIKNDSGDRVVDFQRSNLHVVSDRVPVRARMSLEALRAHLFSGLGLLELAHAAVQRDHGLVKERP